MQKVTAFHESADLLAPTDKVGVGGMQRSGAMARPLPTRRAAEALVCDGETFHCPLPEIWDCTLCQPNQDLQHHFCSTTLKSGLFVKPWELVRTLLTITKLLG